jgi:Cd(II)/Pb(II)-responsive transcriptional regulator
MKIGELARRLNCTPDTIRFYEKEGILPQADRTDANYRTYNESHIERLRFIRNCRALDMTHGEVRALLEAADGHSSSCSTINSLVDDHIDHVSTRIDELVQLRQKLVVLRQKCRCTHPVDTCGIMQELTSREAPQPKLKTTHLG